MIRPQSFRQLIFAQSTTARGKVGFDDLTKQSVGKHLRIYDQDIVSSMFNDFQRAVELLAFHACLVGHDGIRKKLLL